VFGEEIETANLEIMVALAGSKVIVDGGTGFANAGIHAAIRADMVQENGMMLAHCINTQGLPTWAANRYGSQVLTSPPRVEWDVSPAQDVAAEALGLKAVAEAITALRTALAGSRDVDVEAFVGRFGIQTKELGQGAPALPAAAPAGSSAAPAEASPPADGLDSSEPNET
jgi:hypothetical protein